MAKRTAGVGVILIVSCLVVFFFVRTMSNQQRQWQEAARIRSCTVLRLVMSDPTRPNRFFRITVGLLALLVLAGVAIALLVGFNIDRINRDGGYAILMALLVFVALMAIVGVGPSSRRRCRC